MKFAPTSKACRRGLRAIAFRSANGICSYTDKTRLRGLISRLVRGGGLGLYRREFYSPILFMRANFTQLYLHCVWATWDRLPLITPDIQKVIYAAIIQQCEQRRCTVITVGGIEDHVHLLTSFPPTLTLSDLIKQIKGSSSHLITHEIKPREFFKWQGSYGAFSVSYDAIDKVADYIRNQAIYHRQKLIIPTWELTLD